MEAFSGCENLEKISLPDSLEYIGRKAFYACTNLADIILPDSLKQIDYMAFYKCRMLKNLKLPPKTIVAYNAFEKSSYEYITARLPNYRIKDEPPPTPPIVQTSSTSTHYVCRNCNATSTRPFNGNNNGIDGYCMDCTQKLLLTIIYLEQIKKKP